MRGIVLVAAASLLLGASPGRARASPEDPPSVPVPADAAAAALEKEVDRLLADLASDDYSVRQRARPRLEALAPSAYAVLVKRRDHPDPEVRRTVRSLLESLTAAREDAPPLPADLSGVGFATLTASGTLEEVLAKWEGACGGAFRTPPFATGTAVAVDVSRRPYFEALDALLAQAKVEAIEGFDEAGVARLAAKDPTGSVPRAYSGAFRLDVEQVHAIRDFRTAGRMKYALSLRAFWSPHVQVVHYSQPTVVRAVDAEGKAWRPLDPQVTVQHGAAGGRRTWNELRVSLEPSEGAVGKTLAEVEVSMKFLVRHARQEIRFDDPAGTTLPAVRSATTHGEAPGEVVATLEAFGPDPDARGWSLATLAVRLPPSLPGERLAVSLDSATGDRRTMYDRADRVSGSDGLLKLTVRAPGSVGEQKPRAVRLSWYAREGEATVPFLLKGIPVP